MPLLEPSITPSPHFPFTHVELDTTMATFKEVEEHGSLVRSPSWLKDGLLWNWLSHKLNDYCAIFSIFLLKVVWGGDHKRVSLDFRDQTPPKDSGLFKTGVWIFSSKKLTKFGPFRQFFNGVKKEKLFGLHFSTENRHKLEGENAM